MTGWWSDPLEDPYSREADREHERRQAAETAHDLERMKDGVGAAARRARELEVELRGPGPLNDDERAEAHDLAARLAGLLEDGYYIP